MFSSQVDCKKNFSESLVTDIQVWNKVLTVKKINRLVHASLYLYMYTVHVFKDAQFFSNGEKVYS